MWLSFLFVYALIGFQLLFWDITIFVTESSGIVILSKKKKNNENRTGCLLLLVKLIFLIKVLWKIHFSFEK